MSNGMKRLTLLGSIVGLALAGCKVGPDYKAPEMAMPGSFSESGASSNDPVGDLSRWWTVFGDPSLDSLIARSLDGNIDLQIAAARIREARANRGVVASAWYPDVEASGSYRHARSSRNSVTGGAGDFGFKRDVDSFIGGFDAAWELDVFGGTARAVESADAQIQSAVEARRDVMVILVAEIAANYIDLRGAQREIITTRSNLKTQQDTLELTRQRAKAGIVSDLDVARSEAQVATTAATIPTLEQRVRQDMHRLAVLLGRDPLSLVEELNPAGSNPATTVPVVPVGIPSELLRRRPDIRRAERNLAAATADIGVATADLFPRFSLNGSFGWSSELPKNFFNEQSIFWGFGPSVRLPIFNAGRIRSNIDATDARAQQALSIYEQTVLVALQDVEDALVAYEKEQARREELQRAVDSNRRAVSLSQELNNRGLVDFLSVLDAQRALFVTEALLVESDARISINLVSLYKALGGGWEMEEPVVSPTTQPR